MNKTMYLFRHGLATHSRRGYGRWIVSTHILPEGIPPIKKMGEKLKEIQDCKCFSSEFPRCRETSEIVSGITGNTYIFDSRLNEKYKETIGEVRTRVSHFLSDVSGYPQQNIIICTHGVILAAIKNLLLNGSFVTRHLTDFPMTGELMIISGKEKKILDFNTEESKPHWARGTSFI